jgi:hypothetical protein
MVSNTSTVAAAALPVLYYLPVPLTESRKSRTTTYLQCQWPIIDQVWTPQLFYKCFYNQAHRLRIEKLLYLELSRNSNGFLKPLPDPDGGFRSEMAKM